MQAPDDSALLHAARPYDPTKAHEYYLRTRKLKGRKKGIGADTGRSPQVTNITYLTGPAKNQAKKDQHHQEVAARVAALQKRLDRLKNILAELVKAAKERSGVDTKPDTTKKAEPAKDTQSKPKTASQKKEAAAKARDAYKKEHPQSLSKQEKSLQADLQQTREKIQQIREELKASVERARQKAGAQTKPVTAPPGRRH